ncbi:MAG: efflux RND transporter periplasmic adaptor subunit [Bacteroidales bacterium]|nr:efflux RND transporter periplasmic adaptor subunit [Bacteroidales bacterium]
MKKTVFLSLSALALLCACGPKMPEVTLGTETVKRADISTSVTATGTIEPVTKVEVGTQVSGIIDRLYVDYNSEVKKGQLIAELDRTNLQARLASAQAQLESARSDYEYQKLNLSRMETLHQKKFISDDEFETARLQFVKSEATYKAQQLSVNEAKTNLGYAYIYSPIDGVILSREVEEGQTVAAAMTTPTLFTIAQDLTDMRVIADVDEADIGGVKHGQRVVFSVDAYPNDEFVGEVTQVRQSATTTSNVVTYQVVIAAPNPDLKLMPGLTANVSIYTLELKDVTAVSNKALRYTPNELLLGKNTQVVDCQSRNKLWVKEGETLRAVPVKLGASNGVLTQITEGIGEGTEVVNETIMQGPAAAEGAPQMGNNPFMPGPPGAKKK